MAKTIINMADGIITPCNVAGGSGMTWRGIRPNVRRIGTHLVSILTTSPQSTCHSVPVCEILSKSDHPQQKKMTSCWFSRWRISAILDFRGPIMGYLKTPCTRSWMETIALNCFVFEKIAFFLQFGDRQTDEHMDTQTSHEAALAVASGGFIIRVKISWVWTSE